MGGVGELLKNVVAGNRSALARAITLLESRSVLQSEIENKVNFIRKLHEFHYEKNSDTIRIGITGSPGSGKSTFIESFGMHLIKNLNKKIAVLAVDPTSAIRGGSILADKTRMPMMTKNPNAFIRPSPSRLQFGGVTQATGNSILLCEAAGYDVIIVETVGVGQSEYEVAHLCDNFTLLVAPSGGDELQAIKKGIVEMANVIVVTKYDGDMVKAARRMRGDIRSATKFIDHNERPSIHCVSSRTGEGIEDVWNRIETMVNGDKEQKYVKRQNQKVKLLRIDIINELFELLSQNLSYDEYEQRLKNDPKLPVYELVQEIIYNQLYKILQSKRL